MRLVLPLLNLDFSENELQASDLQIFLDSINKGIESCSIDENNRSEFSSIAILLMDSQLLRHTEAINSKLKQSSSSKSKKNAYPSISLFSITDADINETIKVLNRKKDINRFPAHLFNNVVFLLYKGLKKKDIWEFTTVGRFPVQEIEEFLTTKQIQWKRGEFCFKSLTLQDEKGSLQDVVNEIKYRNSLIKKPDSQDVNSRNNFDFNFQEIMSKNYFPMKYRSDSTSTFLDSFINIPPPKKIWGNAQKAIKNFDIVKTIKNNPVQTSLIGAGILIGVGLAAYFLRNNNSFKLSEPETIKSLPPTDTIPEKNLGLNEDADFVDSFLKKKEQDNLTNIFFIVSINIASIAYAIKLLSDNLVSVLSAYDKITQPPSGNILLITDFENLNLRKQLDFLESLQSFAGHFRKILFLCDNEKISQSNANEVEDVDFSLLNRHYTIYNFILSKHLSNWSLPIRYEFLISSMIFNGQSFFEKVDSIDTLERISERLKKEYKHDIFDFGTFWYHFLVTKNLIVDELIETGYFGNNRDPKYSLRQIGPNWEIYFGNNKKFSVPETEGFKYLRYLINSYPEEVDVKDLHNKLNPNSQTNSPKTAQGRICSCIKYFVDLLKTREGNHSTLLKLSDILKTKLRTESYNGKKIIYIKCKENEFFDKRNHDELSRLFPCETT